MEPTLEQVEDLPIRYFLLTYSLPEGRITNLVEFDDRIEAGEAYVAAEQADGFNPDLEVVLLGADSLEALKLTYAHYFDAPSRAGTSIYLAGV